ncbi:hypothetical protein Tco_1127766 [Tanacetum coccineum]
MLGKKPNKVYDPFLKAGLGYQNPKRLKKAIAAQPKMYDGDMLHSVKLIIDSPDSEETFEDAEEKFSAKQTYFSIPSTSNNGSESKDVPSESPVLKMLKENAERRWMSDSQNELREFYKTDVILMSRSLYKNLKEIKEELIEEVQEMLNIFESMEQKVNEKSPTEILLQNEIDLLLEVSLTSEIRDCVLLSATQQKHELLKDELEKSSKVDELIKYVNQKTYAYGDVRAENQDLLMTIFELKSKLRTFEKGNDVNTKFDSSETLGKRVYVTPFNKNIANKAMNMSNTKAHSDRSKPVTSQSTSIPEQSKKHNENVITRGMYKINKQHTKTPDSKANTNVSNSTCVGSSYSVRRSKSKDNKSKNSVLQNTKSSSTYVWKTSNSAFLDSNKCETKTSNVCQTNACISNSKTVKACVNVVNDGSNIVYISCGNDVFLHSHEKCVARHALSRKSSVIQLVLWIVDSGCLKNMTGNLQLLRNLVEKFMGTICFGNDHFAAITGYGDYVQVNLIICHVYYVEGLRHNLFSVGQFCDGDLEVAFRSNTCYVRNLEGDDLLTGSRDSNI